MNNSLTNLTLCHKIVSWRQHVMMSVTLVSISLVQINRWFFVSNLLLVKMSSKHKSTPWHSRVTLYITVTWPWSWLILALVLVQINRWLSVCFDFMLLITEIIWKWINIVTFTRDLVRHSNVTLNVTYPTVTYKVTRMNVTVLIYV